MAKLEKLLDQAQEHLDEGEEVLAAGHGFIRNEEDGLQIRFARGSLRRPITGSSSMPRRWADTTSKSFPTTTFPPSRRARDDGPQVKFFASGNEVKLKWIDKNSDVPAFVQTVRNEMKASKSAPAPVNGGSTDVADQIRKLAVCVTKDCSRTRSTSRRGQNCWQGSKPRRFRYDP